jgi:hypothetical protein
MVRNIGLNTLYWELRCKGGSFLNEVSRVDRTLKLIKSRWVWENMIHWRNGVGNGVGNRKGECGVRIWRGTIGDVSFGLCL